MSAKTCAPSLASLDMASPSSSSDPSSRCSVPSGDVVNVTCPDTARAAAAASFAASSSPPAALTLAYASSEAASAAALAFSTFCSASSLSCCSVFSTSLRRPMMRSMVTRMPLNAPLSLAWLCSWFHTSLASVLPPSSMARWSFSVLMMPCSLTAASLKVPATLPCPPCSAALLASFSDIFSTRIDMLRAFSILSSSCSAFSSMVRPRSLSAFTFSSSVHSLPAALLPRSHVAEGSSNASDANATLFSTTSFARSDCLRRVRCVAASADTVRPTS
mmetsp:Transcript_26747/g.65554  ORF Transcript_26747/g.65554 Transcript_26747/m.65554 type:complete len:275 (-) Transcript_26747:36-860(-)